MKTVLFAAALFIPASASAVITISGLADRQVAADTITFTVDGATSATLDGDPISLGQPVTIDTTGYHELSATDGSATVTRQFIVRASERITTEVGIPKMVPYHFVNDAPGAFTDGVLSVMAPAQFPKDLLIPVTARLTKGATFGADAGDPLWLNGVVKASQFPESKLQLRRGWGSTILPAQSAAGPVTYDAAINGLTAPQPIMIETSTAWTSKGGNVAGSDDWGSNGRISLDSNLTVAAGGTITIGEGTVVQCAAGVEIWVAPGGSVQISGSVEAPVVFVPAVAAQLWGGIWLQAGSGGNVARFTAAGALFCRWGANPNWLAQAPHNNFSYHKAFEPCFAVSRDAELRLTDCALVGPIGLADQRGAAFASDDGLLFLTRTLAQRCITGGELVAGAVDIDSSAILEMTNPGIDVDSSAFVDADNDGLYLVPGAGNTHTLRKTVIGWVKDDGIDTGGGGAGSTIMTRCWFENCIHEACSNSGTGRVPEAHQCVMVNSGQGMECGYDAPQSLVDGCAIIACMVGARFGDNYDWDYNGHLTVRDSIILHSLFRYPELGIYNDVWGMEWDSWTYRTAAMTIEDNFLTAANARHPDNFVWNPGDDGHRLAPFMPVADSNVGVDLLVDRRQDFLSNYQGTYDLRLSTFSSKPVSVNYSLVGKSAPDAAGESVLLSGTVNFPAGETVKTISLAPPGLESFGFVSVALDSPINAEITGAPVFYFASGEAPPDETLITRAAGGWSYQALRAEPANDVNGRTWKQREYIETNWQQNKPAPIIFGVLGTAPNNIAPGTTLTAAEGGPSNDRTRAVYFRHAFSIDNSGDVRALAIELLRDDGAVIYLNGAEVIRDNIDSGTVVGGTITYSTWAGPENINTDAEETQRHNIAVPSALLDNLVAGTNVIAVEVHQFDATSSDLGMDLRLTASFNPPGGGAFGIGSVAEQYFLYWLDDGMTLETSSDLVQWAAHPEIASPIPLQGQAPRMFFRLAP